MMAWRDRNTALVGGSAHPGLAVSLNNLERTVWVRNL
jgi:hypothetical protein